MHNVVAASGLVCIVYAAALVHPALGWLVGGVQLVLVGIGGARLAAARKEATKTQ